MQNRYKSKKLYFSMLKKYDSENVSFAFVIFIYKYFCWYFIV